MIWILSVSFSFSLFLVQIFCSRGIIRLECIACRGAFGLNEWKRVPKKGKEWGLKVSPSLSALSVHSVCVSLLLSLLAFFKQTQVAVSYIRSLACLFFFPLHCPPLTHREPPDTIVVQTLANGVRACLDSYANEQSINAKTSFPLPFVFVLCLASLNTQSPGSGKKLSKHFLIHCVGGNMQDWMLP